MLTWAMAALLLGVAAASAASGEATKPVPVKVVAGLNEIDLDADGSSDVVVKAWRGNFNAHGFFNYAFYRRTQRGEWEVIPIELEPGGELRIGFDTSEGADCKIRDLRLYRIDGAVQLVVAAREFGDSYADSRLVTFSWYALKRNEDGIPGWPPLYFAKARTETTKKRYCDVNEAFEQELPLE